MLKQIANQSSSSAAEDIGDKDPGDRAWRGGGGHPAVRFSIWAARRWDTAFPFGTLLLNVLDSVVIGVVIVLLTTRLVVKDVWRLLIVTGLLGGFITFSTFSYETYGLLISGSWLEEV